jgi:hypothetical protein
MAQQAAQEALAAAQPQEPQRRRRPPDAVDIARALERWETCHVNAHAQRPWHEDYESACATVAPRLARYHTLDELVTSWYSGEVVGAVERACERAKGRRLEPVTVWGAVYWARLLAIRAEESRAASQ